MQNVIERGIILAEREITPNDLPPELREIQHANSNGEGILKNHEEAAIRTSLLAHRGNRRQTAQALGISLRTLQYRLKELGLACKEVE